MSRFDHLTSDELGTISLALRSLAKQSGLDIAIQATALADEAWAVVAKRAEDVVAGRALPEPAA